MNAIPTADRFAGCLIGQCLGDALGFPVEGHPPEICEKYVERILGASPAQAIVDRFPEFGQYTDDSQLARELMQSYAALGRFDANDYASRIAAIFRDDRIVGRGLATHQAAVRLNQGIPWKEAGAPAPSAGNGSAMRAAPIGLFFWNDPETMVHAAHDQGRMTHQDPRCSAGAVAIAGATSLALRAETVSVTMWLDELASSVQAFDSHLARGIGRLEELVHVAPEEAVVEISRIGVSPNYQDHWRNISPFVTGSVLWSLYSFLRSPEDYWETIRVAIAVGGDVDTTAAMAGAISGAYLGLERLPRDLVPRLTDQGTWGYDELHDLAIKCHATVCARSIET
jgi:ADP-ribosylglycohydrolase